MRTTKEINREMTKLRDAGLFMKHPLVVQAIAIARKENEVKIEALKYELFEARNRIRAEKRGVL